MAIPRSRVEAPQTLSSVAPNPQIHKLRHSCFVIPSSLGISSFVIIDRPLAHRHNSPPLINARSGSPMFVPRELWFRVCACILLAITAQRACAQFPGYPEPSLPKPHEPQPWIGSSWGLDRYLRHSSTSGRHIGVGSPLEGTSWANRPYSLSWYMGWMDGDDLIQARVRQNTDFFGGYAFGWDVDHYWGTQVRLGWANLELSDSQIPAVARTTDNFFADVSLLYYPWGDSKWRPYFTAGVGIAKFDFLDDQLQHVDDALLGIPIGMGLKYQHRRWLALRAELLDHIAIGNDGVDTQHNLAFVLGGEFRFGARPKSYWPWNPARYVW